MVKNKSVSDFAKLTSTINFEKLNSAWNLTGVEFSFSIEEKQIAELFNSMALKVIEVCDKIDENLPNDSPNKGHNSKLIYDTSGLKPKVKENNPKTLVSELNKQEAFAKVIANKDFNPYAAAYKKIMVKGTVTYYCNKINHPTYYEYVRWLFL